MNISSTIDFGQGNEWTHMFTLQAATYSITRCNMFVMSQHLNVFLAHTTLVLDTV